MQKNENTNQEKRRKQVVKANENYRNKMREAGMFRFCMWIPKSILGKVRKYIERVKDE